MKIGVFDSGLGGLIVTKAFLDSLGEYDYVYLGDTKNLPYGEKKPKQVLEMTIKGMEFLIANGAKIIIIACNTASCVALRYLQRVYMPRFHPEIKVLGVIVPTVEEAIDKGSDKVGVVATNSTIHSHIYKAEIQKIDHKVEVLEVATPEIVPAIEAVNMDEAEVRISKYAPKFEEMGSLILGCTHYPAVKELYRKYLPESVSVISQDEFMGAKLVDYLRRHPEIEATLGKNAKRDFFVTEIQIGNVEGAKRIIDDAELRPVNIN